MASSCKVLTGSSATTLRRRRVRSGRSSAITGSSVALSSGSMQAYSVASSPLPRVAWPKTWNSGSSLMFLLPCRMLAGSSTTTAKAFSAISRSKAGMAGSRAPLSSTTMRPSYSHSNSGVAGCGWSIFSSESAFMPGLQRTFASRGRSCTRNDKHSARKDNTRIPHFRCACSAVWVREKKAPLSRGLEDARVGVWEGETHPGRFLTEQLEDRLRDLVGLGEHGGAGLLQDLRAGHVGHFHRIVGVLDARLGSRQVGGGGGEVSDGRLEAVLGRAEAGTHVVDLGDRLVQGGQRSAGDAG